MRVCPLLFTVLGGVIVIIRPVVRMPVVAAGVLMVPERHALACRNRRHTLGRDNDGKQRDSEKAEKTLRHLARIVCQALSASRSAGPAVPALDDPASFRRNPHVRASGDRRPGNTSLCKQIIASQEAEIAQMKERLIALSQ